MSNDDVATLKNEIQQQLISSGKYEEISRFIKFRLLEEGWSDQVKQMATQVGGDLGIYEMTEKLEPRAMEMVPDTVKQEAMVKIRDFLESVVST